MLFDFDGFKILEGFVKWQLEGFGINLEYICWFGMLLIECVEKELEKGLIILDYSWYLEKEDFELEFEVVDWDEGKWVFE